jgi:hypothetical protein
MYRPRDTVLAVCVAAAAKQQKSNQFIPIFLHTSLHLKSLLQYSQCASLRKPINDDVGSAITFSPILSWIRPRLQSGLYLVSADIVLAAELLSPPGTVVGGSLGSATLKHREYQVLSRVFIGQRPLIRPVQLWRYKYRDRQLCRGGG